MTVRERAEEWAKQQGCHGPVYRIEDRWGGYWQTVSKFGIYNFRLVRREQIIFSVGTGSPGVGYPMPGPVLDEGLPVSQQTSGFLT